MGVKIKNQHYGVLKTCQKLPRISTSAATNPLLTWSKMDMRERGSG